MDVWLKIAGVRAGILIAAVSLSACSSIAPPAEEQVSPEPAAGQPSAFEQPRLSVSAAQAANLEAAYRQQRHVVSEALNDRRPDGFKAGLTSVSGQQSFNLRAPIAGVLWPDSVIVFDGELASISRDKFRKPMLEMELAFRVGTLIPEPLADVSEAQHVVSEVMPALELPDLGFDSEVGVTGEAVVAANAGARYYVLGAPKTPERVDINAVRAKLHHDARFVQRGEATQVMGNQWRALFWLINTMVEQGWVIQPGQVLLTGAMGEMSPLQAGTYEAHFSELGDIRLKVE